MVGPRFEAGDATKGANAEILGNLTLFADVTDRVVAGVETNYGQVVNGQAAVLVMPLLRDAVSQSWMRQNGGGVRLTRGLPLPEIEGRPMREL